MTLRLVQPGALFEHQQQLATVKPEAFQRAYLRVVGLAASVGALWLEGLQPKAALRNALVRAAGQLIRLGGGAEADSVISVAMPIASYWRAGAEYPVRSQRHLHEALAVHYSRTTRRTLRLLRHA